MDKIDKPLGKVEDGITVEKMLAEHLYCGICNRENCYDIIITAKKVVKMCYNRGQIFLCKKCYKDTIFFDNLFYPLIKVFCRFKRRFGL